MDYTSKGGKVYVLKFDEKDVSLVCLALSLSEAEFAWDINVSTFVFFPQMWILREYL